MLFLGLNSRLKKRHGLKRSTSHSHNIPEKNPASSTHSVIMCRRNWELPQDFTSSKFHKTRQHYDNANNRPNQLLCGNETLCS